MATELPPLPALKGDLLLATVLHRSLGGGGEDTEFGDGERLAAIGANIFRTVVSLVLFDKRPMLSATDLIEETENRTSVTSEDSPVYEWVTNYRLREKIRCTNDLRASLNDLDETQRIFHTYVGAAYLQHSLLVVTDWIGQLLDPDYEPRASSPVSVPDSNAASASSPAHQFAAMSLGSSPSPPPAPNSPPLSPTKPQAIYLPLFNQVCTQKRIDVEWRLASTGPAHQPSWTVDCIVGGEVKGTGAGRAKQQAKEDAARKAYQAMGF